MATFTAFCQDIDGGGTTWIAAVEAPDVESAETKAREQCAADWECDPEDVHCLGMARGDVDILFWDDIDDD